MQYNEKILAEYGKFSGIVGSSPIPEKPVPLKSDYNKGVFTRVFAKKCNEDVIVEVSSDKLQGINTSLYEIVYVSWRISGSKNTNYSGSSIITVGVADQNNYEISKILKEKNVDLKKILSNPLEFWQGH